MRAPSLSLYAFVVAAAAAAAARTGPVPVRDPSSPLSVCEPGDVGACPGRGSARAATDGSTAVVAGRDGRPEPESLVDLFNSLRIRFEPDVVRRLDDRRPFEGRKKKNRNKKGKFDKMGMMMAATSLGFTLFNGMTTKLMMGGVSMLAMKALLIAKLALVLVTIMGLKKMLGGIGGGFGHQSVSWGGGGGGNEHSGYRRNFESSETEREAANALAYGNHQYSYEK